MTMNANKTVIDAFDAPQWTDFTSSPQVSDDFFSRLHPEHELEYHKFLKHNGSKRKEKHLAPLEDESFTTILDNVEITPIKVLSPSNKSHRDENTSIKETTVSDILLEAMTNLELSVKKARLNQSMANSSINMCKTPTVTNKRITRSMSTRKKWGNLTSEILSNVNSSESNVELPLEEISGNYLDGISKIENSTECASTKNDSENFTLSKKMPSRIVTSFEDKTPKVTVTPSEQNIVNHDSDILNGKSVKAETTKKVDEQPLESQIDTRTDTASDENKMVPSRIVTSFSLGKSKETKKQDNEVTKKRPHFLTSIRRQSLIKQKRADQYVSLAEAVTKFQKGTPKRFHSVSSKNPKPGSKVTSKPGLKATSKPVPLKITRPVSPVLASKNRVRQIKAPIKDKTENPELRKIRAGPVKADPKAISTFKNPQPVKKVINKSTKASTSLKSSKKDEHCSSVESLSSTQSRVQCTTFDQSMHKKVVPTIVATDDAKFAVKEVELGHFGIPTEPCYKPKKFTRALPFSFEVRNRELQEKRERRLQKMQTEKVEKTKKNEFHAKPVPSHVTKEPKTVKGITPLKNPKETHSAKKTTPRPFSFEERDKLLVKKKDELIKQTLEKEKKVREFHANPVPTFRAVVVRGRSRERAEGKTPHKPGINEKPSSMSKISTVKSNLFGEKNVNDQENKKPTTQRSNSASDIKVENSSLKTKIVLAELNTNRRARDRKFFSDKLKRKEIEEASLRKKEEEERLLREKAQVTQLRKMAEIKARPMPHYKTLAILKSNKLLTDPLSPGWSQKPQM